MNLALADDFNRHKTIIIKHWLKDEKILVLFKRYNISVEYFVKNFAVEVVQYYIDVLRDSSKLGHCPAINQLIDYLKIKNVSVQDLFVLCSGFKHALIYRLEETSQFTYESNELITGLYEENFFGVLESYSKQMSNVHNQLKQSLYMLDKYMILSRTDLNGNILDVSEPFCLLCGYSKEELIGKNHKLLRDPDTPEVFYDELWKTILDGKVWQGEIRNRTKEGEIYWVYATIQPQFDADGNIIYFDAIRQDVTMKKKLEEQHHLLIEQSKTAAMGEMIAMIAHQWRQPLQAISILVQKLPLMKMLEEEITEEVLDNTVNEINRQLSYMSTTIDDFRDFFKPTKEKEVKNINDVIDSAIGFLSYMFKMETITVSFDKSEDISLPLHDKEIVQVLINIMKNAKDVLCEKAIENKQIFIRSYKDNHHIFIEIEDNAGGIPETIINKIFEPYFSTKENQNGTGLGLYMSKMIIEQHSRGKLSAKNSSLGAVFTIALPLQ